MIKYHVHALWVVEVNENEPGGLQQAQKSVEELGFERADYQAIHPVDQCDEPS